MPTRRRDDGLSATHTATGKLQRALLDLLRVHERDGTLPTSNRFLFYELVQAGEVPKAATGARRADQNLLRPNSCTPYPSAPPARPRRSR